MAQKWDMSGNDLVVGNVYVGASTPGASGTLLSGSEITVLDGVTPGTVTASKAVVVDSNKDISSFRNVTATGTTTLATTTMTGLATTRSATATPAAASAVAAITFGSDGVGIYWGTGSPDTALTAAKGSLYIATDGSSGSTRLFINTDGSTAWTNITAAA